MMDGDPTLLELSPIVRATIEKRAAQWAPVRDATTGTQILHFPTDQAGEQRHLWSGTYYAWEAMSEFMTNLPEGAVIESATLHLTITDKVDTMHRKPSLTAYVSTQDTEGDIVTSEYRNVTGDAIGSIAYDAVTVGQVASIALDPSRIPVQGNVSISLRTSDQIAGQEPVSSHNSRSVFYYDSVRLDVRYHVPAPTPAPEPEPEPEPVPEPEAVDETIEDIADEIRSTFVMPEELTTLIAEATRMAQTEIVWRAPEGGEAIQTVLPRGIHVNLRNNENGIVTGYRATISSSGTIRVFAYRGADLIHTEDIVTGGTLAYENDEGITDVLLQGSFGTAISVSDVAIEVDESYDWSTAPDALTAMSSGDFARASAITIPQPTDMGRAVQQVEAIWPLSGNGSHGSARMFINRDPNQYTLVRLNLTAGNALISDVQGIRLTGEDYMHRETVSTTNLQAGFIERVNERTFLIAPGMPQGLVIYAGFLESSQYSIQTTNAASREALLPPAAMSAETVSLDLLVMSDHHRTEGVFPGVSEIVQGSSPTFSQPGDIANMQYHVRNTALTGGTASVSVYVSWYAGEPTRGMLQGSFSIPLSGGDTRLLSANVTAPSKPGDATSERPSIHVVTRLPNGQTVEHAKLGKLPKEMMSVKVTHNTDGTRTIGWASEAYTARELERINELTRRALERLQDSTDERLVAVRNVLGESRIKELVTSIAQQSLDVAEEEDVNQQENVAVETTRTITPDEIGDLYASALDDPEYLALFPNTTILPNINVLEDYEQPITSLDESWEMKGLSTKVVKFSLSQDSMVNLSLQETPGRLSIFKDGEPLFSSARNNPFAGKSISARMPAGEYVVKVTPVVTASELVPVPRDPKLSVNIRPFDNKIIKGKISREGDYEVMNVKIQKIKITNGQIEMNPTQIEEINPSVPTMIYIHGREDDFDSIKMNDLAKALVGTNHQVLAFDWNEAAKDNNAGLLLGADWITSAAKWAKSQLSMIGLSGNNVILVGHSWGTFVSAEIAKIYRDGNNILDTGNGFGVDKIIALDSAKDSWLLNNYSAANVNFDAVSRLSMALRSSSFGSAGRTNTANINFELISPFEQLQLSVIGDIVSSTRSPLVTLPIIASSLSTKWAEDYIAAWYNEHGFAVSAFASALQDQGDIRFSKIIEDFFAGKISETLTLDPNRPEGMILLDAEREEGWWKAIPISTL